MGFCALLLLVVPRLATAQSYRIPPVPKGYYFTSDYANVLNRGTIDQISLVQREAYQQHDVPIMVVTIDYIANYGTGSIEDLATAWFNEWGIGKGPEEGRNKGILLLIAMEDRKARIELGADYGRRWDEHCQEIMDKRIIIRFKQTMYNSGILAGVRALGEMAAMDIDAPPKESLSERAVKFVTEGDPLTPVSFFPRGVSYILIGLSLLCVVLAFIYPQFRQTFLLVAGMMIAVAFVAIVVLVVLGFFSKARGGRGGFGSGGGFGGGFSGGGGASGSW